MAAVLNFVALLGWGGPRGGGGAAAGHDTEVFSLSDLVSAFDLAHVSRANSVADRRKLEWLNRQHARGCSYDQSSTGGGGGCGGGGGGGDAAAAAAGVRGAVYAGLAAGADAVCGPRLTPALVAAAMGLYRERAAVPAEFVTQLAWLARRPRGLAESPLRAKLWPLDSGGSALRRRRRRRGGGGA